MNNKCKHQFIYIGEASKSERSKIIDMIKPSFIHGIKAGCILCGQIRTLFPDGELKIIHGGNEDSNTTK